ncbi:MAG: aminotransferase class V-fold PLP-dependent enzyme [Planctomycetales bacterium]|jgi:isopenicillin-N epimerase
MTDDSATTGKTVDRSPWRDLWNLPEDVAYLNHGSFGPSPIVVQDSYERWTRQLERQPMNFFIREMEPALEDSLSVLADFVGTSRGNLIFVDNATFGMNVVAASTRLDTDDEVLINDHEYGAVTRLWRRTCQQAKARLVNCEFASPFTEPNSIVEQLFARVTRRTKLIVVSHVTSPTALVMPVKEICRRAKELGIPVCIDGPHAVAMLPLNLRKLDCDFYTASCHKWLSAPFGSGFLYVAPRQQKHIKPAIVSWGGSIGGRQPSWKDEFNWLGTRNPAAFLATADAIRFLKSRVSSFGKMIADQTAAPGAETVEVDSDETMLGEFRRSSSVLINDAVAELGRKTGTRPLVENAKLRSESMISLVLPEDSFPRVNSVGKAGQRHPLQDWLWENHRIEIPVISWNDHLMIRLSAHLYNAPAEYSRLADAVCEFVGRSNADGL